MLTIQPISYNYQKQTVNINRKTAYLPCDRVSFGCAPKIGKLPAELLGVDIAGLTRLSENVKEINQKGYLAEVIKYVGPLTGKIYAIKRIRANDAAKHAHTNLMEAMEKESLMYQKLGKMEGIPEFYYYHSNPNQATDNYLIMSWVDGRCSSRKGIYYNSDLVTQKVIGKMFQIMYNFDKKGVIHNDLWAANMLIDGEDVNIIDFNRAYTYNPQTQFSENNLGEFKKRFLHRYFADLYQRKGEQACLEVYRNSIQEEIKYHSKKSWYYLLRGNLKGFSHYRTQARNLKTELKNPQLMRQNAIQIIFDSNVHCAETFAKHFEFAQTEAAFHCKRALRVMNEQQQIVGKEKLDLLNANITVISRLSEIIASKNIDAQKVNEILELLNDSKIYNEQEQKKPYYLLFKKFCNFCREYQDARAGSKDTKEILNSYKGLFEIQKIKEWFAALF